MTFTPASASSVVVFVGIVIAVLVAFFLGIAHAFRSDALLRRRVLTRTLLLLVLWLGGLSVLVGSGRLQALPFSGLPVFLAAIFAVVIAAAASRFGGHLARNLPLAALVGFQAFRLPLELVLHAWADQGTIPREMTWTGQNWDIISGIVALLAIPLANRHRVVAWGANVVGAILLLNVMRVVILTSPLPFSWKVTPPLMLALHLPYALIAPVCVGGAFFGHIVTTRALLGREVRETAA